MNLIEFPNLGGLSFNIDKVAFSLGSIEIYWYSIIIAVSFMLAVFLATKESKKYGIEPDTIIDLVLFAFPASIIFARLYYVIFSFDSYKDNLKEIINIRQGGLAIYGGLIGAFLVAIIFTKIKKMNPLNLFDLCVPYIALAQAIGRWGNFVNQEAFGANTNLPWGMTGDQIKIQLSNMQMLGQNVSSDQLVHPTFLYESLWNICVFIALMFFKKKKKNTGEVLALYLIFYGIGRFWIEALRTDSLMFVGLRVSQVLSALLVLIFISFFVVRRKKANQDIEEVEIGNSEYGEVFKKLKEDELKEDIVEDIKDEKKAE